MILREAFDYPCSSVTPTGEHIDPCHVAVYEPLVWKGDDWSAKPALATSWEISPDKLEWRFHLREDARFHSGAPCDASAALEPLEHLRYTFPLGQLWYWDPVDTVVAEDDHTLVFRLHYPYARLPSLLWGTHSTVYNEAARAANPAGFGRTEADGTGPFRMVSWSPERVVAERIPDAPGSGNVETIEWVAMLDPAERLDALERGDVEILHGPPMEEVERLTEDPRFVVVEHPQPSSVYLALDWRREDLCFHDVRVREAISLALDRDAIVRDVLAGRGRATWGPIPPGDEFYDASVDAGRRRDLARAQALMREAGVDEPVRCECIGQEDSFLVEIARQAASQLAEIGIELELRFEKPFDDFYNAVAAGPPSFMSKWLWQDAMDAYIGFASTRCKGFPNWQHASVPDLDRAFAAYLRAETVDELQAAASTAQRVSVETWPYVPILTPNDVWVHTHRLRGFEPYPADLYPRYEEARLDADR